MTGVLAPPTTGPASELIDPKQASQISKLAVQTLAIYRIRGTGPAYVKLGSRIFYRRDELESWIAQHRRTSTSDIGITA